MRVKNQGATNLPQCFRRDILEQMQSTNERLWPMNRNKLCEWLGTQKYQVTGEKFGPCSAGGDKNYEIMPPTCELFEEIAGVKLTPGERWLAQVENVRMPTLPVQTPDELRKFHDEIGQYVRANRELADSSHTSIAFDDWARDWNDAVLQVEQGELQLHLNRKTAELLKSHWRIQRQENNREMTMRDHRDTNNQLAKRLRTSVTLESVPLVTRETRVNNSTTGQPPELLPRVYVPPMQLLFAHNPIVSQDYPLTQTLPTAPAAIRPRSDKPKMCRTCGHSRHFGPWGTEHFHSRSAPKNNAGLVYQDT